MRLSLVRTLKGCILKLPGALTHPVLASSVVLLSFQAQAFDTSSINSEFSLELGRSMSEMNVGTENLRTEVESIGVGFYQIMTPRLDMGFLASRAVVTQPDNPLLAGREIAGYQAGLVLRRRIHSGQRWQWLMSLDYRYLSVAEKSANQTSALTGHRWGIGGGGRLLLAPSFALRLEGSYQVNSARLSLRGDINQSERWEAEEPVAARLTLEWLTDATGAIELQLTTGVERGGWIRFSRRFR